MTTLNEFLTSIDLVGVDDNNDLPGTLYSFQMNPRDGRLEMRKGEKGDKGDKGDPAYPFEWQGDMTNQQAIDNLHLGPDEKGWAYRNVSTQAMHYWAGVGWIVFPGAFGAPGPRGLANQLTVGAVTTLPTGSNATLTITGTPPNQVLNIGIPRGIQGQVGVAGGPGPLRTAPDYDNSSQPQQGDMLAWQASSSKFKPVRNPGVRGPYSIGYMSFPGVSENNTTNGKVVATLQVPAQNVPWRPMVFGAIETVVNDTNYQTRLDAEVRIGSASGQIVGLGTGFPYQTVFMNRIQPYFDVPMDTSSNANVGVIQAGQAVTLNVVLTRPFGTATYSHWNRNAYLVCHCIPVY
ncbi:hypothetical protein [Prescottella agglutinans]|uniref:Tetrahydromethanopterin S-methyltransferase subunit F n=1 Tax=Prescottella agglutinans TaxID=1644129 RepID=A0ABT6MEQ4_9NOCA|nr:hypothetical protein [Prescottella agglutinans]MDH6282795.1 tetrahydromethanopterin S-methyltransferase subunit F [Prescottella agglutinans]